MTTLFKHVLSAIEDNNNINDAEFKDWSDAEQAISIYAENEEDFDLVYGEREATVKALNMIIDSNADKDIYEQAVTEYNETIWGVNFSNHSGPVPFGG